ncbi:MAG TPA: ABC-three component system protein [Sphingobacteriaceae bacterium]
MANFVNQSGNTVTEGDLVAGNKTEHHYHTKPDTRLSRLFKRLESEFKDGIRSENVSDNLKRYSEPRDIIGLEQKLKDGNKEYLIDDASWLKQEYFKKLTKFQFFESAQEIHAILLGIVLERFRNIIYPQIREENCEDKVVQRAISEEIIQPILKVVQEEGCDDVMGLTSTDIEGMVYFLTGQCHIKWCKDDSLSPGV